MNTHLLVLTLLLCAGSTAAGELKPDQIHIGQSVRLMTYGDNQTCSGVVVAVSSTEIALNLECATFCGPSPRKFESADVQWIRRNPSRNQQSFAHGVRTTVHAAYMAILIPISIVVVYIGCAVTGDCL
jgi:hypothetical protein